MLTSAGKDDQSRTRNRHFTVYPLNPNLAFDTMIIAFNVLIGDLPSTDKIVSRKVDTKVNLSALISGKDALISVQMVDGT